MVRFCSRIMKVAAHNVAIFGLVESIKILTGKIEDIDVSVADKVSKALEATIDAKVEARVEVYDSDLRKMIAKLEEDINCLKNKSGVNNSPDVTYSKAYEDDGACSNDLVRFFIIFSLFFVLCYFLLYIYF